MRNYWKRTWLAAILAAVLLLAGCFAPALSAAEGAEPYGDGDGVISRAQLAGLYNWLNNTNTEFYKVITFDQISDALGKKGFVKEKDRDEYHAAYWTDGDKFVTVTFKNNDGSWGVTSVTTDILSEEYSVADYSFLPRVGNRWAGSSATEAQTMKAKVQGTSDEVIVTAQVPVEYWTTASSFGEARILNVADVTRASGNSAGIRVGFWPDEASRQAEREKAENVQELEDWAALGTTLKGYSFTKNGMDMTEYVLPLKDDLCMSLQFYKCDPCAGSEAEAIVYSLVVEYGDFTYSCDVQPEPPAVSAPAAPAAEADGGFAGKWIAVEMSSGGETMNPADYGMEMSIELREDGTAVANLGEEVTGTWSADGNQVEITIDGDTATAAVENGEMVLPLGDDVSLKLVKDGAAAPAAEPEPTAEPAAPVAAADGGFAGKWTAVEMVMGGETENPADYGIEMSIELREDGTAVANLGDEAEGTWSADGNQVSITIEGDTAVVTVEDGVMVLPVDNDITLKLVKDGAAAPAAGPEPTAAPAAGPLDADEEAYVGVWHLIYLGTGGFTGNAADIGLTGETLTMNADRTSVLSTEPDAPARKWRMEDGIIRLDNEQRLMLLREDVLQYGSELSGYMIFSKDPAMTWDGSIPLFDPFASTEPEPTEVPAAPAPTAAPEAPAPQGSGEIRMEVKYTAKTYVAAGVEIGASALGAEYSVVFHEDGTLDFTMAGTAVPGLLWKADGDALTIDYYGAGEIRVTADDEGIAFDMFGTMTLKMVP